MKLAFHFLLLCTGVLNCLGGFEKKFRANDGSPPLDKFTLSYLSYLTLEIQALKRQMVSATTSPCEGQQFKHMALDC